MKITRKSDVYVYIAGKYTDKTMILVEQNILDAKKIAVQCTNNHIKFFCPHTHTAHFGEYAQNTSWQYYMDLCEPILRKICNVIFMVPNWEDSKGAKYEFDTALKEGHMIFTKLDEFFEWYKTLQD